MKKMAKQLTKEECIEALKGLLRQLDVNETTEWSREKQCWVVKEQYQRKIDLIEQLINEHFDNTLDFKHFKLHSKSYLKIFKKDELIDYIYMVYRNWQGTDSACNRGMRYAEKLQKINDELQRVVDELNSKETRSNPPLKLEELHENMWVWDNKCKYYVKIFDTHEEDRAIEIVIIDKEIGYEKVITLGKFEENRFYRYEVKPYEK